MVYIHVPFCRSFCTYCDFYSEIACKGGGNAQMKAYLDCLKKEIEQRRDEIAHTGGINTLYIGGGTPSVLPLDMLEEIVRALGPVPASYSEFTVEVNPDDIIEKGEAYVRGLLNLGVNRISMGVQSLSDDILRWMNRRHDSRGARDAFSLLKKCGVRNISVDIIFGISVLSDETLEKTVAEIIEMRPEHISAYQLTVEEGSVLDGMIQKNLYSEASDEQCRREYEMLCTMLSRAGYEHYEISNWALPGYRAEHNSAYWRREPYVGLGPAAHSLTGNRRSWNSEVPSDWKPDGEILSEEQIREETIMLGLRTKEGVDGKRIDEMDWFIADTIIAGYL